MVEKSKSGKNRKTQTDDLEEGSKTSPDVGGLAASLDALMSVAEKGKQRNGKDSQSSPDNKSGRDGAVGSAKELVDELDEKYSGSNEDTGNKPQKDTKTNKQQTSKVNLKKKEEPEALGVVELLGALKSDIDSLRKDNEEFKTQLMGSPLAHGNNLANNKGDDTEVRDLLAALQADIGSLRQENDSLRSQAFVVQEEQAEKSTSEDDDELYQMLGELKADIVSLRSENDALRQGNPGTVAARPASKNDEVARMLQELKGDISDLKHENEAQRLENLTARDGAHFENLGGQADAYRNETGNGFSTLMKGLGALVVFAGAAGGGYYLAKSENPSAALWAPEIVRNQPVASMANKALNERTINTSPTVNKPVVPTRPVKMQQETRPVNKPANVVVARTQPAVSNIAPAKISISSDVETAMLARADGLMETRDLGAARMVFVYLARHGSAGAMNRLAQTYDPQYLVANRFDETKNSDLTRAKRLYGAASGMGDLNAAIRLKEMQ